MTRSEAVALLNAFLTRSYRPHLTSDDLVITQTPGLWLFKQPCLRGAACHVPHPENMKEDEPIIHRVVFMDWERRTCEVWETLRPICRTCGLGVTLSQESDTIICHYPETVETVTFPVTMARCEKCGPSRVWV